MRNLVSIRTVDSIHVIPGAGAIECARIGGWPVVVKKGEFKEGDEGVFFEIDSFLPAHDERYSFLLPKKITWNEKEGMRLRTIKLRGQLSQGLLLPLTLFPELVEHKDAEDYAALLNVEKWERQSSASGFGSAKVSNWPSFLRRTDQERIQNIPHILEEPSHHAYEVTIKLDGSSMTIFRFNEISGVCSRNVFLDSKEDDGNNNFSKVCRKTGILPALEKLKLNIAVQGELIGPGIQGNQERATEHDFYIFDIFDIDRQEYMSRKDRLYTLSLLQGEGLFLEHVPILQNVFLSYFPSVDSVLEFAEGKSLNPNVPREGVVFKRLDGQFSFKAIANSYLLKNSDK